MQARYRLPVAKAGAGNLVLVEGLDAVIAKTATVIPEGFDSEDVHIFRPLRFQTRRRAPLPSSLHAPMRVGGVFAALPRPLVRQRRAAH